MALGSRWTVFGLLRGSNEKRAAEAALFPGGDGTYTVAALGLAGVLLPYFCLNFSTRPAVSTIFCLPV